MDHVPKWKQQKKEEKTHYEENKFVFWSFLEKVDKILHNNTTNKWSS